MRKRNSALALLLSVGAMGCNQIFGLEPPVGGDGTGDGGSDAGDGDGGGTIDAPTGDRDADGVPDGVDNCPDVYNPSQADEDGDGAINGGDVCDLCPDRPAPASGGPHLNADVDQLGDDCDPSREIRHCLSWFDGFQDGEPSQILARYSFRGGVWRADDGALHQDHADGESATAFIFSAAFKAPLVVTAGTMHGLPVITTAQPQPYRNLVGVVSIPVAAEPTGSCFASVTRDVNVATPGPAKTALAHRTTSNEVIVAEAGFPPGNVQMVAGERFAASLDLSGVVTPVAAAIGSLPDRGLNNFQVTGSATCTSGTAGVRTAFAAASFAYLMVIETEPVNGCPPRGPAPF